MRASLLETGGQLTRRVIKAAKGIGTAQATGVYAAIAREQASSSAGKGKKGQRQLTARTLQRRKQDAADEARKHKFLGPLVAWDLPGEPLNALGEDALRQALSTGDASRVRLLLGMQPSKEVLMGAANAAGINVSGRSECARLVRSALGREEDLAYEQRIGADAARAVLERAKAKRLSAAGAAA